MSRIGIKTKLIAMHVAILFVVMTVSGTFMLMGMRNMEIQRTQDQLFSHAARINTQIVQSYHPSAFVDASGWGEIGGQGGYEIQSMIMNYIGLPIAPMEYVGAGLSFNDRALMEAVYGAQGFSVGRTGTDLDGTEQQWISFAMPVTRVTDGIPEDFIIYTRINAHFMNESLARVAFILVSMVLIALGLTIIFWFVLANAHIRPILAVTKHMKAIATGDFQSEIDIRSSDEIGQLALSANQMAKDLQSMMSDIASEKNKSEAILQNTSHGVLAYDSHGVLIHANHASADLLHGILLQEATVVDLLGLLGFNLEDVTDIRPGNVRESTYEDGELAVLASVTTYTDETDKIDGYIIVLQDVTRQTKLDNMRKEFVANVSHELRTPLTSIRTYTETLLEGAVEDPQMATKFLKVINDESERMTFLITDLLELSRLDASHTALEMDIVDLVALLRLTIRQSQFLADKKNQQIEVLPLPASCFIEANAARINQVISNIISNSIKYSPENTTIKIWLESTDRYYRVFVQDQGMGIPAESLSRIFERFYRVDKARARAMGGTGLGLAIVKEIMEEHGGRVTASSQMGKGTTMALRFNKCEE